MMIQKPTIAEYPTFYHTYISKLPDKPVLDVLAEGPAKLENMLLNVSDDNAEKGYAPGKWSVKELVGHMQDTERIMAYRCLCISRGEGQPLPGFDENEYVANANFNEQTLVDLLVQYKLLRQSNLTFFQNMTEAMLMRSGLANGNPVTARALVAIIAGHELHHLGILEEKYLPMVGK